MKRSVIVSGLIVLGLAACSAPETDVGEEEQQGVIDTALCVDTSIQGVCSQMPTDVVDPAIIGYDTLLPNQQNFDYFSWKVFIALNWPATGADQPSSSPIGTDLSAPRIWQYYQGPQDVFVPSLPSACPADAAPVFELDTKVEGIVHTTDFAEAFAGPLIDVNGNFAVFDIRLNDKWTEYVTGVPLNSYADQATFGQGSDYVDFPQSTATDYGAMEVKTSWRVVPDGQESDFADYYTLSGYIALDADETSTNTATCLEKTLALVGMHIVVRTGTDGSDWIWGTFEHTSNAPMADTLVEPSFGPANNIPTPWPVTDCTATPPSGSTYSFFNASCTQNGAACTPNVQPPSPSTPDYQWDLSHPDQYAYQYLIDGTYGTQATRCLGLYSSTVTANTNFQAALNQVTPNNVWANYELVGTQWAVTSESPVATYIPAFMANSTMETYMQTTTSCLACHAGATILGGSDKSANFSWTLREAVPVDDDAD